MKRFLPGLVITLIIGSVVVVQAMTADGLSRDDREAITQCALDYIDGYYTADEERMDRAVHADLAKRIVRTNPNTGQSVIQHMTAEQLVGMVASARGPIPEDQRQSDVTILDVFENAASVKIVAGAWIDYLHVGRVDDQWKIINVLWEMKPQTE